MYVFSFCSIRGWILRGHSWFFVFRFNCSKSETGRIGSSLGLVGGIKSGFEGWICVREGLDDSGKPLLSLVFPEYRATT